jgi:hypothetical protein
MTKSKAKQKASRKGNKHRSDAFDDKVSTSSGSSPLYFLSLLTLLGGVFIATQSEMLNTSKEKGTSEDLCNCGGGDISSLCWQINASATGENDVLELNRLFHLPRPSFTSPAKIGIFQMFSDEIASYSMHTSSINAAYAKQHGYDYMITRVALNDSEEGDYEHAVTKFSQSKMKHITDALLTLPEGGWLMWMDSDFAVLRDDISIESILETHAREGIDLVISKEFNTKGLNTGSLLLRRCDWTFEMLKAWHLVGYSDTEDWSQSSLSQWGSEFKETTGKRPPDQQMHNELLRQPFLNYLNHTTVLDTTIMNSRWPAWAIDSFDEPSTSKAKLQFALHMFSSTTEERDLVFGDLHRRALCEPTAGETSLRVMHPTELSLNIAANQLTALGKRALDHPRRSFANAELCVALYMWVGGPGPLHHDEDAPFHRAFRFSDRHMDCLDPGIAAEVGKFMIQRRNLDAAYFALKVALEVSELLLDTKAPLGSPKDAAGSLDPEAEKSLLESIEQWRDQFADVELSRTEENTFFTNKDSPGMIQNFGAKKPSRREARERAKRTKR